MVQKCWDGGRVGALLCPRDWPLGEDSEGWCGWNPNWIMPLHSFSRWLFGDSTCSAHVKWMSTVFQAPFWTSWTQNRIGQHSGRLPLMEFGEVETCVKGSNGIRWDLSEANVTGWLLYIRWPGKWHFCWICMAGRNEPTLKISTRSISSGQNSCVWGRCPSWSIGNQLDQSFAGRGRVGSEVETW